MKLTRISLESLDEIRAPELGLEDVHLWVVREAVWQKMDSKKPSREVLSRILCVYLDDSKISFDAIEFEIYGEGKLRLSSAQNKRGIHFNLSHSHGLLVIAITVLGEVGVDVEWLRPMEKREQLSERFYFQSEQTAIREASETDKDLVFFQIWTAKEAWAKLHATSIFRVFEKFELEESHYSDLVGSQATHVGSVFVQNEFASFSV